MHHKLSNHASVRRSQRGVPHCALALLSYAQEVRAADHATFRYFSRHSFDAMRRDKVSKQHIAALEKQRNLRLVVSQDNSIITILHASAPKTRIKHHEHRR